MEKYLILLLSLLLCSCGNSVVTCKLEKDNKSINIQIDSINDDISSIKVRTCFDLPNDLVADPDWLDCLSKQLDDTYHFEDNLLISEYVVDLDDTYSLNKTLIYLRGEKYYCE